MYSQDSGNVYILGNAIASGFAFNYQNYPIYSSSNLGWDVGTNSFNQMSAPSSNNFSTLASITLPVTGIFLMTYSFMFASSVGTYQLISCVTNTSATPSNTNTIATSLSQLQNNGNRNTVYNCFVYINKTISNTLYLQGNVTNGGTYPFNMIGNNFQGVRIG
jgi:hypothetical protein